MGHQTVASLMNRPADERMPTEFGLKVIRENDF